MINEFKAFIMKGNVMDLAVAVIIGTAFGKIISSLVSDIHHASDRPDPRRDRFYRPGFHRWKCQAHLWQFH